MTTEQYLLSMLTSRGLSDNQASSILNDCKPIFASSCPEYSITWDKPCKEYPEILYSLWWKQIKEKALIYINENIPQAWFKPMFEG